MKILVLTDASKEVGMGHYTRMRAIANSFLSFGFMVQMLVNGTIEKLQDNESCINWKLLDFSHFKSYDFVVIDSYLYCQEFLDGLVRECRKVLVIDDLERLIYRDCMVLNPNLYGETLNYTGSKNVHFLVGPSYCLLRDEFLKETQKRVGKVVSKVFVTFGGTDPFFNSLQFLRKHKVIKGVEYVFALGVNTDETLKTAMYQATADYRNISVKVGLSASEMYEEIRNSDVVVSAAGQTVGEVVRLMKPAFFVKVVENQKNNFNFIKKNGTGVPVEHVSEIELDKLFSLDKRLEIVENMEKCSSKMRGISEITCEIVRLVSQ